MEKPFCITTPPIVTPPVVSTPTHCVSQNKNSQSYDYYSTNKLTINSLFIQKNILVFRKIAKAISFLLQHLVSVLLFNAPIQYNILILSHSNSLLELIQKLNLNTNIEECFLSQCPQNQSQYQQIHLFNSRIIFPFIFSHDCTKIKSNYQNPRIIGQFLLQLHCSQKIKIAIFTVRVHMEIKLVTLLNSLETKTTASQGVKGTCEVLLKFSGYTGKFAQQLDWIYCKVYEKKMISNQQVMRLDLIINIKIQIKINQFFQIQKIFHLFVQSLLYR